MEIKIENKSCTKRKCDKKEMEKLVEVMILPSIGKGTKDLYMSQMLYAGQSARPSVTFLSDF